jgi:hypothetical protein
MIKEINTTIEQVYILKGLTQIRTDQRYNESPS